MYLSFPDTLREPLLGCPAFRPNMFSSPVPKTRQITGLLPCGSPSAKADARCPVAVWFLALSNAYKIFLNWKRLPQRLNQQFFLELQEQKQRRYHKWPTSLFWGGWGGKPGRLHQFFLGSKRSCVFSKGFKCMEIPFPGWNFPLASSQVSMAAEMDSAPQGICRDKNRHFLENWVNLYPPGD